LPSDEAREIVPPKTYLILAYSIGLMNWRRDSRKAGLIARSFAIL